MTPATLRALAAEQGLPIGTCVGAFPLAHDPLYAELVAREFSIVTPENAMKLQNLCRGPGTYGFEPADAIVDFARRHGLGVRGHVLVWYRGLPGWLLGGTGAREVPQLMTHHIETVVGRYKGRVAAWDVVNEAIGDDGTLRSCLWSECIGPSYVEMAFHAARAADPDALLFYNDYGIEATRKHRDAVYDMMRRLLDRGCPLDGVGLQMHLSLQHRRRIELLHRELERLGALGLRVHITELDVRIPVDGSPTTRQLDEQADLYREILAACLDAARCEGLTLWGASDLHSWVPRFFKDQGAPLLFDEAFEAKPAYQAMVELLVGRRTRLHPNTRKATASEMRD